MKKWILLGTALLLSLSVHAAEDYVIDTRDAHAFVQFKVSHIGFSWLYGRFNDFEGRFSLDLDALENSSAHAVIRTNSVDTNNPARDRHLQAPAFLDAENFPEATFQSTGFAEDENGGYVLTGDFTLRGVTRPVTLKVEQVGAGEDPWGGFRRGFSATTTLKLADFDMDPGLGPSVSEVEIIISVEGKRQQSSD